MSDPDRTRLHSLALVSRILAGEIETEQARKLLRTPDRTGILPSEYAAMSAARDAHDLLELKTLLEPPGEEEKAKLDLVLDLLERIAENQIELGRRMDALESAIGGRGAASRSGSPTASARRASAP